MIIKRERVGERGTEREREREREREEEIMVVVVRPICHQNFGNNKILIEPRIMLE